MATLLTQSQQENVSQQNRMPVNNSNADAISTISGETLTFKFYSGGTLTNDVGQATGTVVVIKLANNNILNSLGDVIGNNNDTSFSFGTGTILTSRVPFPYNTAES